MNINSSSKIGKIAKEMQNRVGTCPIFPISNVTGKGILQLQDFMSKLRPFELNRTRKFRKETDMADVIID